MSSIIYNKEKNNFYLIVDNKKITVKDKNKIKKILKITKDKDIN